MAIDTDKERSLIKKLGELRKKAEELLTKEQSAAIEKYIETLYEIEYSFAKKAFFKGCEFAVDFTRLGATRDT